MPACACVPSALPGGCRQSRAARGPWAGESQGRGRFGTAPGQDPIPHAPGKACPARACVRERGTGACVPAAGKVITWRKERPAQRNRLRAGRAGAPARAPAAFCPVTEGSGGPQLPAAPMPAAQPPRALQGGEGLSAPRAVPPPPGGKGAAQGSRARCAGSCRAAERPRTLVRKPGGGIRLCPIIGSTMLVASERGRGSGTQTSPAVLNTGKGSLAGDSGVLWTGPACRRTWSNTAGQELAGTCRSDLGCSHKRVPPAGRIRRGVGTGGG